MKRIDLKDKKFGKWTVLSYAGNRGWRCKCDCGIKKIVSTGNLRNGFSTQCRNCGPLCGGGINRLPEGVAVFNDLFGRYKRSAEQRNIIWNLTKEEVKNLFSQNCIYCGIEPIQKWSRKDLGLRGEIIYNGIDRIDNSIGYTKDNSASCCKKCNYMKRELSVDDFLLHIKKIIGNIQLKHVKH